MERFPFPKGFHLQRSSDFRRIYGEGAKRHSRGFILFRRPNGLDHPRLGLSVGRRFGKAVRRNRVRRLVREAVRLNWRHWGLAGSDVVVIAKRGAEQYGLCDVTSEFKKVFLPRSGG